MVSPQAQALLIRLAQANSAGRGPGLVLIGVSITAQELVKYLDGVREAARDARPFLEAMAAELPALYRAQYASGAGWSGADLVESGRLRASLTSRSSAGHVERISRSTLFYGTSVPYAAPLKRGARGRPERDPGRLNQAALGARIQDVASRTFGGSSTRRLGI